MNQARLEVKWTPSVSTDIKMQHISVTRTKADNQGGENVMTEDLGISVGSQVIPMPFDTGDLVSVWITSTNELGLESQIANQLVVPNLEPPQPATGLGISIIEVVPVEAPPTPVEPPPE